MVYCGGYTVVCGFLRGGAGLWVKFGGFGLLIAFGVGFRLCFE